MPTEGIERPFLDGGSYDLSSKLPTNVVSNIASKPEAVGGTLAFVTVRGRTFAVAALTDREAVHVVQLEAAEWTEDPLMLRTVGDAMLERGDAPGRVVGAAGRAYVALRGAGAIATIDPATAKVLGRWRVCAEPYGLAFDDRNSTLHVACASGDLITLDAESGEQTRRIFVGRGLQEVAVFGAGLLTSDRAHLFVIGADGSITSRRAGNVGLLRTAAGDGDVVLVQSTTTTSFVAVTPEGTLGPSLLVRSEQVALYDMSVTVEGDIAIAGGGNAFFLLSPGGTAFSAMGAPGVATAVAVTHLERKNERQSVVALQTTDPRMLHFLTGTNAPTFVAMEALPQ